MKNLLVLMIITCFTAPSFAAEEPKSAAEPVSSTSEPGLLSGFSRVTVGVEGLGPGLYYSAFGSFRILKILAVNAGVSYFPVSDASTTLSVLTFPISVSALFGHNGNFELNAGITFLAVSGTVTASTTTNSFSRAVQAGAIMPFFGAGYRLWPLDGGFSLRAMAYGLVLPGGGTSNGFVTIPPIAPWIGVTVGYAF